MMKQFRVEKDAIGTRLVPEDALFGIHALRAKENFPDLTGFPVVWFKAIGLVKAACYETVIDYNNALRAKFRESEIPVTLVPEEILFTMMVAAKEISDGKYFDHFIVPAVSGGAGTSINMNVNEIIANAALISSGRKPGEYSFIDPIGHANVFQSTNDVVPTALKVALMQLLTELEGEINRLRNKVEERENEFRNILRIGYTQMQEAVPSSFGKLFSTYSEALSRDWWRVSKCFERIKLVNLGGGATGSGMAVPRFFIMEATAHLQRITGLPVARSENLADATSNLDSFVEVHATLKAHAVNLEKMASDLRLLGSDIGGHEVKLPERQTGSSVMPGKINPVIPEFVISSVHRVYSNDQLITSLSGQGCLELNAYLPVIGCALIESLNLLSSCCKALSDNLFDGLQINSGTGQERLFHSPSITTALIPYIGYHKAGEIARQMKDKGIDVFTANKEILALSEEKIKSALSPENLLKLGYSIRD